MTTLTLHDLHANRGAVFGSLGSPEEIVRHYRDPDAEYRALHHTTGLLDLSFRGRLSIAGPDAVRYLHGQVTQDIKGLQPGHSCYSGLTDPRARLVSDLQVHALADGFFLDFEPGLTSTVTQRFRQFLVAEKVRISDLGDSWNVLSLQGPMSAMALAAGIPDVPLPPAPRRIVSVRLPTLGSAHVVRLARTGTDGFDLFVEAADCGRWFELLEQGVRSQGGSLAGWDALDLARLEAGHPRFGVDMEATDLLPETGLENTAVSYSKGCYIGQEVIARVRTYGRVTRALRGLRLPSNPDPLPARGDAIHHQGKPVGALTSIARSPRLNATIALGYLARDATTPGTEVAIATASGVIPARVVELPFQPEPS
jgi:folate-binding protein YgfZ